MSQRPKSAWVAVQLPTRTSEMGRYETALQIIYGAIAVWATRQPAFAWRDYPHVKRLIEYCSDRLQGGRISARPQVEDVRRSLDTLSGHLDPYATRSMHELLYTFEQERRLKSSGAADEGADEGVFSTSTDWPESSGQAGAAVVESSIPESATTQAVPTQPAPLAAASGPAASGGAAAGVAPTVRAPRNSLDRNAIQAQSRQLRERLQERRAERDSAMMPFV